MTALGGAFIIVCLGVMRMGLDEQVLPILCLDTYACAGLFTRDQHIHACKPLHIVIHVLVTASVHYLRR